MTDKGTYLSPLADLMIHITMRTITMMKASTATMITPINQAGIAASVRQNNTH
jgi:hypothetical protein